MPSAGLPQEVTVRPHICHHPHRFNELDTKSGKRNREPRLECVNGRHHRRKLWVYCPGHAGVKGMTADRLAGKVTLTSGLLLGRSEVLRSLSHYLWAQSQGYHAIDRLEEIGVERGFIGRTRESRCQSDEHWNRFKGDVGETFERDGVEHIWAFPSP